MKSKQKGRTEREMGKESQGEGLHRHVQMALDAHIPHVSIFTSLSQFSPPILIPAPPFDAPDIRAKIPNKHTGECVRDPWASWGCHSCVGKKGLYLAGEEHS